MESHTLSTLTAVKLEGQRNWSTWKFQVTVSLKGADLWSIVNGTEKKTEQNKVEWAKKDAKAQSIIVSRLSEAVTVHVLTCETAEDIWNKLQTVFEPKSPTATLMLQQKFLQFKYEGGGLSVYLSKLQELKCQLKQGGEEVSDKFLMTKILMSLPESYSHFICAWESVETSKQNYEDLVARLLIEEERLKARESRDIEDNAALYMHHKSKGGGSNKKCYRCGKTGHFAQQCHASENRRCFVCDKIGHLKADCPKLKSKYHKEAKFGNLSQNNAFIVTAMTAGCDLFGDSFVIDSGASEHLTGDMSKLTNYQSVTDRFVVVGDGRRLPVLGIGEMEMEVYNCNTFIKSTFSNVLYVPEMKINLLSVLKITNKGYEVTMQNDECLITKDGVVCGRGSRVANYYVLNTKNKDEDVAAICSLDEWHERLCHQNYKLVRSTLNKHGIEYLDTDGNKKCETCALNKISRMPFTASKSAAGDVLDLVHGDVAGPMEVPSIGGSRYFLLLKDDLSNYRVVYFLKRKSEVADKLKEYILTSERYTSKKIKVLRTDNGTEFVNREIKELLGEMGISHQTTVPYHAEQNGRAEREMRTLVEAARSMISGLGKELWAEAINMAVYILNRTAKSRIKGKTPYELWESKEFDVTSLKMIFGSEVAVHIPKEKRLKWDPKGKKGIFVGYEKSKGYRIYCYNTTPQ